MALPSNDRDGSLFELPLELWERIIDIVAGNVGYLRQSQRHDIIACCLVCRAFVTRCRFHLYYQFTLRSGTQLEQLVHTLSASPILCNRLHGLTIDGRQVADQSWVSAAAFRLPPSISSLGTLFLRDVDLSVLHPEANRGFSRIRIPEVHLRDVRYSSYTQLTRFFSISNTVRVHGQPVATHEVAALRRLPPRRGPQRFYLHDLSWAVLDSMTQSLDLSTCTGDWGINVWIAGSRSWETSAVALANLCIAFEHICGQPDRQLDFRIRLHPGAHRIAFHWYDRQLV